METKEQIINKLIKDNGYTSYLEIGVQNGKSLKTIECSEKVGVDPNSHIEGVIKKTSDEFFSKLKRKFDIIFIDGLHHADQVIKDIVNSMKSLNKGGVIVVHDINPSTEKMCQVPRGDAKEWTGDVYKAFFGLLFNNDSLLAQVYEQDYGVGVIHYNETELNTGLWNFDFNRFNQDRNGLFNKVNWMKERGTPRNEEKSINIEALKDKSLKELRELYPNIKSTSKDGFLEKLMNA